AKTAELCACCCRLGAHFAGATSEQEEVLARYGRHLGIAFQIVDDLLDLEGREELTGKSLGSDLAQLKPTLPLIRLLERLPSDDRAAVAALLNSSDGRSRSSLDPWLSQSDALAYTRDKAVLHARAAQTELSSLSFGPAAQSLYHLADSVVRREA